MHRVITILLPTVFMNKKMFNASNISFVFEIVCKKYFAVIYSFILWMRLLINYSDTKRCQTNFFVL